MEKNIDPVRPMFDKDELTKGKDERLIAGTNYSGVVIDVNKEGIQINAYYSGFREEQSYAVLRKPVIIPWEEIDKLRKRQDKKGKKAAFSRVEEVDEKYLEGLPIVVINGNKYYIDPERRERRPIETPNKVWKF